MKKRIFTLLCNSSPSTLQVVVALIVTTVIHLNALVTYSSPESLYLAENVNVVRLIHSSPIFNAKRVTSEICLQIIDYEDNIPCKGDEWVTSAVK